MKKPPSMRFFYLVSAIEKPTPLFSNLSIFIKNRREERYPAVSTMAIQ